MVRNGIALYMREEQGCKKLCLGMGEEPAESLWIWISGQNNMGNVLMAVCYKTMIRNK